MNKTLIFLFFSLIASISYGQTEFYSLKKPPVDTLSGRIAYSEDVQVLSPDNITAKEELFSRALSWFKYDFPSPMKFAVAVQDGEAGEIVAKALIYYSFGPGTGDPYSLRERMERRHYYIEYTISIDVKDGGYKYLMTDFNPLTEKAGSRIADRGFPKSPGNTSAEAIDSVRLKRLETGDYNLAWGHFSLVAPPLSIRR